MSLAISILPLFIIAVLYIVYRSRFENKITNPYLRYSIDTVLVIIILPICVYFITDEFNRDERQKQEEFRGKQEEFTRIATDSIISNKLESKDLERIITEKYQDIFDTSEENAQTWAKDFINSLPTKQKNYKLLSNKSEELANLLKIKWDPIVVFTLKQFDNRIKELKKQDISITLNSSEIDDFIIVEDNKEFRPLFRSAKFPNGNSITVTMRAGMISKGILILEPFLRVQMNMRHTREGAFKISFQKNSISLVKLSKFINTNSINTNDIMIDDKFFDSISKAIEESIAIVVLDDMENVNTAN